MLTVPRQGCRAPDSPHPAAPERAARETAAGYAKETAEDDDTHDAGGSAPSLLADLLTAAVHARASYGYAMQAGHLSSITKFAMLHTVRRPSAALCTW